MTNVLDHVLAKARVEPCELLSCFERNGDSKSGLGGAKITNVLVFVPRRGSVRISIISDVRGALSPPLLADIPRAISRAPTPAKFSPFEPSPASGHYAP